MVKYENAKENRQTIVLTKEGEVLAAFGSLRKVVNYINEKDGTNISYWTHSRKQFPIVISPYKIWKVKRY